MSDPAEVAAQRALSGWKVPLVRATALDAAREALKPIRELHVREQHPAGIDFWLCRECSRQSGLHYIKWPCGTAPLIYTTEELMGP